MKSVNLFLHLSQCDVSKADKSADATAEKLMEFLNVQMDLSEFLQHFTFTSDYAIFQHIFKALEKLGSDLKIVDTKNVSVLNRLFR